MQKMHIALAAALMLSACAGSGPLGTTSSSVVSAGAVDHAMLAAVKGLKTAQITYDSATKVAVVAVNSGKLSTPQLLELRRLNNVAFNALVHAENATDAAAIVQHTATVSSAAAAMLTLLGK